MDIYRIRYANKKGMAWAAGYGPVAGMWFLKDAFLRQFEEFWKVNPQAPGIQIEKGGRTWPDILGCGNAPPPFFVSRRVVEAFEEFNVSIERCSKMPIAEVRSAYLKNQPPPDYFVIEVSPGIRIDLNRSEVEIDNAGNVMRIPKFNQIAINSDSWNGAEVFRIENFGGSPSLLLLCTQRFKDFAVAEEWENIEFEPLKVI